MSNPSPSKLDQTQILQRAFDGTEDRLRVDADLSVASATVTVETDYSTDSMAIGDPATNNILKVNADGSIDANVVVDAASDSIRISDGTDTLAINADGSINVNGVATAANQTTGNNSLAAIEGVIASTKNEILKAPDVVSDFTWADFGLSTQRLISIEYSSATVHPGVTATKTFAYTLVLGSYRLDSITWSVV